MTQLLKSYFNNGGVEHILWAGESTVEGKLRKIHMQNRFRNSRT